LTNVWREPRSGYHKIETSGPVTPEPLAFVACLLARSVAQDFFGHCARAEARL